MTVQQLDTSVGAQLTEVSKTFPGMKALDRVSFGIQAGHFHALVGGNGSGKSTLIKILAGVYQADPGGTLRIGDSTVPSEDSTPLWSRHAGIRFVHQDLGLIDQMSVAENLCASGTYPKAGGRIDWKRLYANGQAVLDRLHVPVNARTPMSDLRPAESTLVAIARCLQDRDTQAVNLLVLDEPTARLPQTEVDELLERLRAYSQAGQSILYVSHRLDEVLQYADSVTVLRDGKHVESRPVAGLDRVALTTAIVGGHRDIVGKRKSTSEATPNRAPVLQVTNLAGGPLRTVNLSLYPGEIVGISGLVGSGRTSLLETIFGVHGRTAGTIQMGRHALRAGRMDLAIVAGMAYVPEDRARDSAFRDLGLEMNLSAAGLGRYMHTGWFRRQNELADAAADVTRLQIRTPGTTAPLSKLSGGNQQKVILARWLRSKPILLLLDEPTQGVDVGARAEIYEQIESAVATGAAVLLVTSDLEELLHLSDRVVVMERGSITASAEGATLTRGWVVHNMFNAPQEDTCL